MKNVSIPVLVSVCFLVLTLNSLGRIPDFHLDSQYYIQSAILWSEGKTTFAASWIGSRDLVVWLYHVAFSLFGYSIDSLIIVITVIKIAAAGAAGFLIYCSIENLLLRAVLICVSSTIIFSLLEMNIPATENVAILFAILIWAFWVAVKNSKFRLAAFCLFAFVAGVSLSIRTELILLPLILVALEILRRKFDHSAKHVVFAAMIFVSGAYLPSLLWNSWVPAEKPHEYSSAIAFYRLFNEHAKAENGPASRQLSQIAGKQADSSIDYWAAIGKSYVQLGPEQSNRLVTSAGIEALTANISTIMGNILPDTYLLLTYPGGFWLSEPAQFADLAKLFKEFDEIRIDTSQKFGNDAVFPTITLTQRQIGWVSWLRSIHTKWMVRTRLPAHVILVGFVICSVAAIVFRDPSWIGIPLFGLAVVVVSVVSQGIVPRYLSAATILNLMASVLALIWLLKAAFQYIYKKGFS